MNTISAPLSNAELDAVAVEAVKHGDGERYRELVERYEQKVYAVAWCRLGNPDLAREATQEAFIKGYRQLAFLSQGGKFAAWITAIARNAAINLGIRQRNDLKKHARWALETAPTPEAALPEEPFSPQSLSTALAALPAHHRESLVLFYLEGKSITEAAASLGVSETAFKTRLHRARGILREQLEDGLGESLGRLRPRHALAPGIMALLATTRAEAATAGTGIAGKLLLGTGKLLPLPLMTACAGLAGIMPGALLAYRLGKMEQRNYREPGGFRVALHQAGLRRALLTIPLLGLVVLALSQGTITRWGLTEFSRACGLLYLGWLLLVLGPLWRNRNPFLAWQYAAISLLVAAFLGVGFFHLPMGAFSIFQGLFFVLCAFSLRHQPLRMDYNLFLRARENLLPPVTDEPPPARPFSRLELRLFARFLCRRWLAINYRETADGMQFRLPQVRPGRWRELAFPFLWRHASTIAIGWDGEISATLGRADYGDLTGAPPTAETLTPAVIGAVRSALAALLTGDVPRAEAVLGHQPEAEIFRRPLAQSRGIRLRFALLLIAGPLIVGLNLIPWWLSRPHSWLAPVRLSEADVRAMLAEPHRVRWEALSSPGEGNFWLLQTDPPKSLLSPEVWAGMREDIWQQLLGTNLSTAIAAGRPTMALLDQPALQRAYLSGLFTDADLKSWGITPAQIRQELLGLSAGRAVQLLQLKPIVIEPPAASTQAGTNWNYLPVDRFAPFLQALERFHCLDLIESKPIIETLRAQQVRPGNTLAGYSLVADLAAADGLFHCAYNRPLKDTYEALVILSLLHGLDAIDQPACIRGILRLHRGGGWFARVNPSGDMYLPGDASDTFFAYESLRLLHALDQVPDLKRWKFRPGIEAPPTGAGRSAGITWSQVEAWLYQQRLQHYLEARRRDLRVTAPSLQTP